MLIILETSQYAMASREQLLRTSAEAFLQLLNPATRSLAVDSINAFTRSRIHEESLARQSFPPTPITETE